MVRVKARLQSQKPSTRGVHSAPLRGCEEAAMGSSAQTAVLTLGGQGADVPLSLPRDRIQRLHCADHAAFSTVNAGQRWGADASKSKALPRIRVSLAVPRSQLHHSVLRRDLFLERPTSAPVSAKLQKPEDDFCFNQMVTASLAYKRFPRNTLQIAREACKENLTPNSRRKANVLVAALPFQPWVPSSTWHSGSHPHHNLE